LQPSDPLPKGDDYNMDSKLEASHYQRKQSDGSSDPSTLSDDFPTIEEVLSSPIVQSTSKRKKTLVIEDDSDESIVSPLASSKRHTRAGQMKTITRRVPESDADSTSQDPIPKKTRRISKTSFGSMECSDEGALSSPKRHPTRKAATRTLRTPRKQMITLVDDDDDDDDLIIDGKFSTPPRLSKGSGKTNADTKDTPSPKRKFSCTV
jgi:hypothetical protein